METSGTMEPQKTEKRKGEHVHITLEEDVEAYRSAGFREVDLVYRALPELNLSEVDSSCEAFGKDISSPIYIEGMTGGYEDAKKLNRELAAAAEEELIPFEVGSMRAMIEKPQLKDTYHVRDVAKSIPLIGNIGVAQLKDRKFIKKLADALKDLDFNALSIHINPIQELVQPEGDRDFSGCLEAIGETTDMIDDIPIIAKEVGAGISGGVAKQLEEYGCDYVNICGVGGTSWTAVELLRSREENKLTMFRDFGIPTVPAILDAKRTLKTAKIIASGGVRSGLDSAKCIALGAEYASAALPFLKAWKAGRIKQELKLWKEEFRAAMYLTGSKDLSQFRKQKALVLGKTAEYAEKLARAQ